MVNPKINNTLALINISQNRKSYPMTEPNRTQAPEIKINEAISFKEVNKTQLDNGILVHFLSGGTQDVLRLEFVFPAGVRFQSSALVARFTNNMLTEGTDNMTADEIAEELDTYGAFIRKDYNRDTAQLSVFCLRKQLNKILPVIADVLCHAIFPKEELDVLLSKGLQEHLVNMEKVAYLARRKFTSVVFGSNHPYGSVADPDDFNKVSESDLIQFYNNHYNLSFCQLFISGNVTDDVIQTINHHVGQVDPLKVEAVSFQDVQPQPDSNKIHHVSKKGMQSAIRMGKTVCGKAHEDHIPLTILNTVLGGYFGSRLMSNIREDKGYTYGIGSGIIDFKDATLFIIATEVGNEVCENSIKEIHYEMNRLIQDKIHDDELELVRNYLYGTFMQSIDGPFSFMDRYRTLTLNGYDLSYYENYLETLKTISADQLQELAGKYLHPDSFYRVVAGA